MAFVPRHTRQCHTSKGQASTCIGLFDLQALTHMNLYSALLASNKQLLLIHHNITSSSISFTMLHVTLR